MRFRVLLFLALAVLTSSLGLSIQVHACAMAEAKGVTKSCACKHKKKSRKCCKDKKVHLKTQTVSKLNILKTRFGQTFMLLNPLFAHLHFLNPVEEKLDSLEACLPRPPDPSKEPLFLQYQNLRC